MDDIAMIAGTGGTTGQPKGRDAFRTQSRDDVRPDADELSVRRPPRLSCARAVDSRGRRLVFPDIGLGRPDRHHAQGRPHRVSRPHPTAPGHPYVSAADLDLHAPGESETRRDRSKLAAVLLVRRRADFGSAVGRGDRQDRARHGAVVRTDRGADDDLDDGPEGSFQSRRDHRPWASGVGRKTDAPDAGRRDGRARPASADRRARRDRRARIFGDGGLLQERPRRPPRSRASIGITPATSVISTRRTFSISWTAPKT